MLLGSASGYGFILGTGWSRGGFRDDSSGLFLGLGLGVGDGGFHG